jgi:hypothetical protein
VGGGGEDGAGWTLPFPRHVAYAVAVLLVLVAVGWIAAGLWYEDDACEGDSCRWGVWGLAALFYAGIPAVLLASLGVLWTLADIVGLARIPERLRLGFRPRLDRLAVGLSFAIAGGFFLLVLIDDLDGL